MELLVWHAALGSDDEQATETERAARLLYAYSDVQVNGGDNGDGGGGEKEAATARGLHALQFMEALAAFTRLLRRPSRDIDAAEWINVTLATRRFFLREMEPQIFFALGIKTADVCGTELRSVHEAVLQQIYDVFRLFSGRVGHQLRALPPFLATRFPDGMALLHHLAALRRRLRKIAIAQELEDHDKREADGQGETRKQHASGDEEVEVAREVEMLEAASPSRVLWKRCDVLFPKLLRVGEIQCMNMFHELDGVAYFPTDEATFLSMQTLVSSLLHELEGVIHGGVALFYRGNVLWRTVESSTLLTLQRFLRLREQDGMDVASSTSQPIRVGSPWMDRKYDDAFSPVWASKTTYAECAVVKHIAPHPRSTARSLHKQAPSSMSTLVNDLMETIADARATAEQLQIRRGQRYRSNAPVYRNRGFLSASGYFLPSWELAKPESNDMAWAPTLFPLPQEENEGHPSTALLYHENDLSLVVLTKPSANNAATLQHMERIEDCLEKVQFAAMATTIWKRFLTMTASQPSREKASSTPQPPYIYLNRVNLAFKASDQIPRLVKTKEPDLYPRPASLWAHYLPAASLALLNDAHETLNGNTETVELRVKTVNDGWLVSQRSCASDRVLFALFDTKAASVADAQDATNDLLAAQFSNIYL